MPVLLTLIAALQTPSRLPPTVDRILADGGMVSDGVGDGILAFF